MHVHLLCDNAVAESASWKGLSTAKGLCHPMRCFLHFREDCRVAVYINHIPGILNDLAADKLRRSSDAQQLGFQPDQARSLPWSSPASLPVIQVLGALS